MKHYASMKSVLAFALAVLCIGPASAELATLQSGATSQQIRVRAIVASTGLPDTALAYNTSGLSCNYQRPGAASTSITLATQTVTGAYSSGGFVHVVNGWYRLDVPDAAIAVSAPYALVSCTGTGDTFVDGVVMLSPPVNTVALNGTAQTARDIGASVLVSSGTGTGQISLTSGIPAVNVTQFGGTAATTSAGRPEVNTSHLAGSALGTLTGAYPALGIIESGTAQAGTSTTLQLRSAANFTSDNRITGASCLITGGTGAGESLNVASYVNSTDTATMAGTWPTTPDNTSTYICFGTSPATGATDPWATALPGSYTSGQAGNILAAVSTKTGFLPSATAGAAGGVLIAGTNADFDVTANASFAGGVTITQSTSNQPGLSITGNGTGAGLLATSGSGATGNGIQATAASTNGNGVGLTATGTGLTMTLTPSNVTQFGGMNLTASAGIPSVNSTQIGGQTASASGTVTFPNATLASTTNITAGTIATVTNLTNAPTAGDLTATMKTSIGTAVAASAVASVTGNVGGNVTGSVGSVTGAVGSVTGAVGSVTGAVGSVTGNVGGSVASIASGGISEASFATTAGSFKPLGFVDQGTAQAATATTLQLRSAATFGDSTLNGATIIACGSTQGYCQSAVISAYVGSTDTATVPTWAVTPSGTITYYVQGTGAGAGGAPSAATVASAVWDLATSGHTTGGTFGNAAVSAGSAGDPWATSLPGAYSAGTAGNIIGNRIDAAITSRLAPATSGRTLVVDAAGLADANTVKIGPTGSGTAQTARDLGASVLLSPGTGTGQISLTAGAVTAGTVGDKTGYTVSTVSDKTGYALSTAGNNGILDATLSGHTTGGTVGGALNSASSAGDPWATLLPGAYTSGQAGNIIGNNLNASMTSRMATFTLPTNFSTFSIDGSGRTLLQPTQTGVTIPTVTTLTNAPAGGTNITQIEGVDATDQIDARIAAAALATAANLAAVNTKIGTPSGASVSADIAAVPTGVLNSVVEPNGSISLKCVLAAGLAYNAGDLATVGTASTYKDPSNTSTRISATVASAGNRLGSVTCPP